MRLLITRPIEDAKPLADALRARGHRVEIEPLLAIASLTRDPDALARDLAGAQALLFTSANGVRAFAGQSERRDVKVLAIGAGTAEAARAAGFEDVTSAAGDVAALAELAQERLDPKAGALFHAAGATLAGDLAGRLEEAGFEVRRHALYEARTAERFSAATAAMLRQGEIDAVLFFSPRTGRTFAELWHAAGRPDLGRVAALCLSANVEREIAGLPFARRAVAAKPELDAMLTLVDDEARRRAPAKPTAPARGGASLAAVLLGALLAGSIGAAAAVLSSPLWLPLLPGRADSPQHDRLADLEAKVAATADGLATQEEAGQALAVRLDELEKRRQADLAQLRAELPPPAAAPDLTPVEGRLAALEAQVAALAGAVPPAAGGSAELAKLREELASLDTHVKQQQSELGAVTAAIGRVNAFEDRLAWLEDKSTAPAAPLIGLIELRRALLAATPFAAELAAAETLAEDRRNALPEIAPILGGIAPLAAAAAPGLAQLQASFPAEAIAAAARREEKAAAPAGGESWPAQIWNRLTESVKLRPLGEVAGDGAPARVARAEVRLNAGDLPAAVAEVEGLQGEAKAAAAAWLAEAKARLERDAAAQALTALLLARLAPDRP